MFMMLLLKLWLMFLKGLKDVSAFGHVGLAMEKPWQVRVTLEMGVLQLILFIIKFTTLCSDKKDQLYFSYIFSNCALIQTTFEYLAASCSLQDNRKLEYARSGDEYPRQLERQSCSGWRHTIGQPKATVHGNSPNRNYAG